MCKWNNLTAWVILCVALMSVAGCWKKQQGGPRVDTFPIIGTVLVDGEPAATLQVQCHPSGDVGVPTSIACLTDKDGKFSISSYERGDGAPEGEYKVTFFWGQYGMSGYGGKDKLNEKYLDPKKSEFTVTVKKGEENDLGVIELSTK